MRGMNRHLWLFVLAMVLIMVSSSVQAQDSKITFSSDFLPSTNRDIWAMNGNGSDAEPLTEDDDLEEHWPSTCLDGQKIVYDDTGGLYVMNYDGTGRTVIDTGPANCNECTMADCGRVLPNDDLRIVFRRDYPGHKYDILIATVDMDAVPVPKLIDVETVAADDTTEGLTYNHHEPEWCGGQHVVWSHSTGFPYKYDICVVPISCPGGPPCAEVCLGYQNGRNDTHPSCNQTATKIVFAQEQVFNPLGEESDAKDICTVEFDKSTMTFSTEECFDDLFDTLDEWDDTMPSWNPGGTLIAFASNRPQLLGTDYEIWVMNQDGTDKTPYTNNYDEDDEPNWGPGVLGTP